VSRIALVPSAYLPTLGGVQELTRHLALALVAAGDEVEVWTQQADEVDGPTEEILDGLTVRRFHFPLPRANPRSLAPFLAGAATSMRALRAARRAFRPDVLHVQCFGPNGAYATALSLIGRTPLVLTLQGETEMDDADIFDISSTMRTALRLGIKRASVVTACSGYTLRDAEKRFGLDAGRGEVIFNGVDLTEAQPPPADTPGGPDGLSGRYVLALGRMVDKKGFDLLIRAFALIADRHPDVNLALGGSGPSEAPLRALAEETGLTSRVDFVGRLSRTDVAAAMAGAEVFVMPSRLEPFGIVVLEGWRAGAAVVATSRGGPPEYITDGTDGLLADPFDTEALAAALDRLLGDGAFRWTIAGQGRQRVRDFDWPQIAAEYRRRYATCAT
jgi:glycogen(starch) synthase